MNKLTRGTVVSLVLKVLIIISVVVGTVLSTIAGRAAFMGGK